MHNYLIVKVNYTGQKASPHFFVKFKLKKRGLSSLGECVFCKSGFLFIIDYLYESINIYCMI